MFLDEGMSNLLHLLLCIFLLHSTILSSAPAYYLLRWCRPVMIMTAGVVPSTAAALVSSLIVRPAASLRRSRRTRSTTVSLLQRRFSSRSSASTLEDDENSSSGDDTNPPLTETAETTTPANKRNKKQQQQQQQKYPPLPCAADFPDWAFGPRDFFSFEILHQSAKIGSRARVGRLRTPHGSVDTPGFVAVATNAALKGVDFRHVDGDNDHGANGGGQQLVFANTYHLLLHPGADIIAEAGGIHKWTNRRHRPFITDSGGFQVFSLAYGSVHEELTSKGELKRAINGSNKNKMATNGRDAVQVTEDGAVFRSYRDGSKFLLTPESTVQAQKKIGADIILPLDELPGYYTARDKLAESVARTHRWEARSLREHLKDCQQQAMYCVVHGGVDRELRQQSVDYLTSLPFDGYAIGGSLGNGRAELKELLAWLMPMFHREENKGGQRDDVASKPRHLLGIADEESVRNAVSLGVDTLDSCYPTRLGRHGTVMTRRDGLVKLKSGVHRRAFGVKIDDQCSCSTCQHYDRAYLWHLFKANEPVAVPLATIHNIHYMNDLMARLRRDILDDKI